MSTIKSSDEHLTLNADGSSKDIKFQANGVEKASISSAGAFTSTTIDATKLTGTIPNFTSTGIDDNADATAITIDSSENVGIGTATSPSAPLHIKKDSTETSLIVQSNIGGSGSAVGGRLRLQLGAQSNSGSGNADTQSGDVLGQIMFEGQGTDYAYQGGNIKTIVSTGDGDDGRANQGTDMIFETMSVGNTGPSERLRIKSDGRGLSQFTAKAWVNFNGSGTVAIQDSHNVSSITDHEIGSYSVNFANDMANANFSSTLTAGNWETTNIDSYMACGLYDTASGQTVSKQKFRTIRLNMSSVMFKDPKTVCGTFFGD